MTNRTNYARPVTNTTQIVYDHFRQIISNNLSLLRNKRIVIFGAGVRGALLALVLKDFDIDDIIFSDNNEEIIGGRINQYPIINLKDVIKQKEDVVVLVSPENNKDIIKQLEHIGFIENENMFNCGSRLYNWFINQFIDNENKDIFIVGDCGLMYFSLNDANKISISDMIKKQFSNYRFKQLTMNAMGMRAFYNMLLSQFDLYTKPKYIFLSVDISVFNGKQHYMPNAQHVDLINKIYEVTNTRNNKLFEYLQVVKERYNNSNKVIINNKGYSSSNLGDIKNKVYIKMNYMYKLNNENEELRYFIKILELLKEESIIPILFILPINYCQGRVYYGDDFIKSYQKNTIMIKNIVKEKGYDLLDLSFMLDEKYFLDTNTMDEAFCYEGRLKACNEITNYFRRHEY
ncbi:MAG: hypothetical protein N4A63_07210 [Vallitalea sp.]|nr:hypothetical protein [Vallitalea sp.]